MEQQALQEFKRETWFHFGVILLAFLRHDSICAREQCQNPSMFGFKSRFHRQFDIWDHGTCNENNPYEPMKFASVGGQTATTATAATDVDCKGKICTAAKHQPGEWWRSRRMDSSIKSFRWIVVRCLPTGHDKSKAHDGKRQKVSKLRRYHSCKYRAKWILSFWIAISAIFQNSHLAWLWVLCSAGYHLSCTCAMGKVVDAEGRVKGGEDELDILRSLVQALLWIYWLTGVENLRVADASIMPSMTSGNLNAYLGSKFYGYLRKALSTLSHRCQIFTSEMYSRRIVSRMCQVKAIQSHCTLQWSDSTNYCEESRGWFLSTGEGRRSWWQNCLRIEYVEKLHFRQRTCRSLGRKENEIFRWNGFGGSSSILFRIVKHTAMSVDPFSSHLFSPHPLLMLCQKLNLRTESKSRRC